MESWRVVAPSVDFQPRFWMVLVICWAHPLSLTRQSFQPRGHQNKQRGQLWLHFWSKAHLFDLRHSEPRHRGRCSRMSVAQGFRGKILISGPLIQRWISWRWLWCHLSNSDLRKFFPPQQTSKIKQTGPSKWQECHTLHLLQGLGASIIYMAGKINMEQLPGLR